MCRKTLWRGVLCRAVSEAAMAIRAVSIHRPVVQLSFIILLCLLHQAPCMSHSTVAKHCGPPSHSFKLLCFCVVLIYLLFCDLLSNYVFSFKCDVSLKIPKMFFFFRSYSLYAVFVTNQTIYGCFSTCLSW